MKALKIALGLIYDDPWLAGGIVIALLLAKMVTVIGLSGALAGVVLMILLFLAMLTSVLREAGKKKVRP